MILTLLLIIFYCALIALAIIDIKTMRLPNWITYPLIFLGIAFNALSSQSLTSMTESIIGAILGYLFIWTSNKIYLLITDKEGIGMGDAKLLASIGALLGASALIPTLLIGSLLGLVGGLIWLKINKLDKSAAFPFGPYLSLAGILVITDEYLKIGIVQFLAL